MKTIAAFVVSAALIGAAPAVAAPHHALPTCSARMGQQRDLLMSRNHQLTMRIRHDRTELTGLRAQVRMLLESNAALHAQVDALVLQVGALVQATPTP